jgi:hypothetical protein
MSALHELTWPELCAGVRAGQITPAQATEETMARFILVKAAEAAGIIRHGLQQSQRYPLLLAAFQQMAQQG